MGFTVPFNSNEARSKLPTNINVRCASSDSHTIFRCSDIFDVHFRRRRKDFDAIILFIDFLAHGLERYLTFIYIYIYMFSVSTLVGYETYI